MYMREVSTEGGISQRLVKITGDIPKESVDRKSWWGYTLTLSKVWLYDSTGQKLGPDLKK